MTRAHLMLAVPTAIALSLIPPLGALPGEANGSARSGVSTWTAHLGAVDGALARGDVRAAERAWQEAYLAALGSWRWDGMLEVADAHLRIGELSGARAASVARARNLYLGALFRARDQGSVDGVLRTAEAFARLGDGDVAAQCVRIAQALAARTGDPRATERVRASATALPGALLVTGRPGR